MFQHYLKLFFPPMYLVIFGLCPLCPCIQDVSAIATTGLNI